MKNNMRYNIRMVFIIVLGLTLLLSQLFFLMVDPRPEFCDDCIVPLKVEWIDNIMKYLTATFLVIVFTDIVVLQTIYKNRRG